MAQIVAALLDLLPLLSVMIIHQAGRFRTEIMVEVFEAEFDEVCWVRRPVKVRPDPDIDDAGAVFE